MIEPLNWSPRSSPPLSQLVAEGLAAGVTFGLTGEPVRASELVDIGATSFLEQADAGGVGILMSNDRPTVEVVLGALATGARLVSLPPPGRGADLTAYAAFLRRVCDDQDIAEVVVADELGGPLESAGVVVRRHSERHRRPLSTPSDAGFELVQFSSGSTGDPRAAVIGDAALGTNVTAVLSVVQPRPGDVVVSWLPLAHDLGLVGMLFTGLAGSGRRWAGEGGLMLLAPRTFLRRPASWLEALTRVKGTFTAAPDFGYRMAVRRASSPQIDLSSLRCAIIGGEIVRSETLIKFAAATRDSGFDSTAFCPAYGMAELGLAATLTPPDQDWRDLRVSSLDLAENVACPVRHGEAAITLVSSGPPLPGYEVATCAADNTVADHVERIALRGPSIGLDPSTGMSLAGSNGWLSTGDVGFVNDGWLYVCGRTDDYVVANGRNVYAPAVEAAVAEVDGVREGRVTVVGLPTGDWVVVAEHAGSLLRELKPMARLRREVRRVAIDVATATPDDVIVVAPGSLPLTASGKLQRHVVRSRLLMGTLLNPGEQTQP